MEGCIQMMFTGTGSSGFAVVVRNDSTEQPAIVYCTGRSCDDALLLALELMEMGKTHVFYFVDGFEVWQEWGMSVESGM